ncbi:MAG: ComEC/Rec2 family competence protein, partial [Spirochaetes bacterium]|nr:ComEC/Rec2 family competence protein [Spirochaetota bacterium]
AVAASPAGAHSLSFKLSYLAVAGIAVLGPPIEFGLRRWLPPPFSGALATGFAALAAAAPVSILAFGTVNPFSPVSSAVAGVLVAALMWVGIALAAIVAILPAAAAGVAAPLAAAACAVPYRALAVSMGLAARLPSLSAESEPGRLSAVVALGAAFVYAWPYASYYAYGRSATRQLRLPDRPVRPPRGPRPGHAQEVRPELPRLGPRASPHRRPLRGEARKPRLGDRAGDGLDDARGARPGPRGIGLRDR